MANILEQLDAYFKTNSREKVLKDWDELKEYAEIGPTVDDFFDLISNKPTLNCSSFKWLHNEAENKIGSPEFSSDFFLYLR